MKTTLILDASNLGHRARHTTGMLSYGDMPTGVIYGVLRDVSILVDKFDVGRVIWAFDQRPYIRNSVYPAYKANRRKELSEEEIEDLNMFYDQMSRMKNEILPSLGYANILSFPGYEADDVIASVLGKVVKSQRLDEDHVVVSADTDLWQCLYSDNIYWHNPITGKTVTRKSLLTNKGVSPSEWVKVKAMAGCSSDNVSGIYGVGEKTAIAYLQGKLKPGKKLEAIENSKDITDTNMKIVELPYSGMPDFQIREDDVTLEKQLALDRMLGFRSKEKPKFSVQRRRRLFDA